MNKLNNNLTEKASPSGVPVKPKKSPPAKEETIKIPVPCALTEEHMRGIAREEIERWWEQELARQRALIIKR